MEGILKSICLEKMADKIKSKGIDCSADVEAVLRNLGALATEVTDFGEVKRYIPLNIKEIVLSILYPNSRIHCELTHSQDSAFWCAEAFVYLNSTDEQPKGEGRFAYTLKAYADENNMSEETAVITIGNWVRGLAKTRAIQSALPFLNLYCDEDVPDNENPKPEQGFPQPQSQEDKKAQALAKAAEKKSESAEVKEPAEEPVKEEPKTTGKKKEKQQAEEQMTAPVEEPKAEPEASKTDSEMTLEEAREQIADVGNCKGHTLGEIYDKQPRNIVWMLKKGGSQLEKALMTIILQDDALKAYL